MQLISVNTSTKELIIKSDDGKLILYDIVFPDLLDPLEVASTIKHEFTIHQDIHSIGRILLKHGVEISLNRVY